MLKELSQAKILAGRGSVLEAISVVKKICVQYKLPYEKEAIMIESSYSLLRSEKRTGIIAHEDYLLRINRINLNLLEIIDDIERIHETLDKDDNTLRDTNEEDEDLIELSVELAKSDYDYSSLIAIIRKGGNLMENDLSITKVLTEQESKILLMLPSSKALTVYLKIKYLINNHLGFGETLVELRIESIRIEIQAKMFNSILKKLPEKGIRLFKERNEGKDFTRIAKELGYKSDNTVKKELYRFRKQLRKLVEKESVFGSIEIESKKAEFEYLLSKTK